MCNIFENCTQDESGFLLENDVPDINASASEVIRGSTDSDGAAGSSADAVVGQAASFKSLGYIVDFVFSLGVFGFSLKMLTSAGSCFRALPRTAPRSQSWLVSWKSWDGRLTTARTPSSLPIT